MCFGFHLIFVCLSVHEYRKVYAPSCYFDCGHHSRCSYHLISQESPVHGGRVSEAGMAHMMLIFPFADKWCQFVWWRCLTCSRGSGSAIAPIGVPGQWAVEHPRLQEARVHSRSPDTWDYLYKRSSILLPSHTSIEYVCVYTYLIAQALVLDIM